VEGGAHPAGTWVENRRTGELGRLHVSPADTEGRRLVADLYALPGAAVVGEHVHDQMDETFTVLAGTLDVRLDGAESRAVAGETVEIPAGTAHDWWNSGDTTSKVRVEVAATPGSGPMADRFLAMIEALFSLAQLGHTDDDGKPGLLWLAPFATEYRDVLYLSSPPLGVQRALFGPLAALGRALGRRPTDPSLHGPGAPCVITPPDGFEAAPADWMPPQQS
jgi:quercetin dioxygenase-like cupin family protein